MPCNLPLPEELTIYEASTLHQLLAAALLSPEPILLDLSHVSDIDCAALQVLLWAQAEAQRLGRTIQLCAPSPAVCAFLRLLGLDKEPFLPWQDAQS